uniref:hypothetical protein n=1 Tax=Xenorhabdus sp. GDc328 TaxID=742178 RepID=UPI000B0761B5
LFMIAFNHLRNPQIEYLEDLIVRKIFSSKNLTLSEELLYKRQPPQEVVSNRFWLCLIGF